MDNMVDPDFILVGGGAAGCALAARLARGLSNHRILLLDAGGQNHDASQQSFGERFWTQAVPGYNWGYKTVPQENLDGREIDYSRGKGLGGSTAINLCVFTRGPSADYDHWAQLVGDDGWAWKNSLARFNKIESFRQPTRDFEEFVNVLPDNHGRDGPVNVSVAEAWDPGFGDFMKNSYHYLPKNLDHNSGNPIGISIVQLSALDGRRVTASTAYLASKIPNLEIVTEAAVSKVIIQGNKAIGVEVDGKQVHAKKEVILAAGAVDSPKLLLLSGIGPEKDLQALNIPIQRDLSGVGTNLQDHLFLELVTVQEPDSHNRTSYIPLPGTLEQARREWMSSQSGPLSNFYLPQMVAFLKSDTLLASKELQDLGNDTRQFLRAETKPLYEIISHNPSPSVKAPEKFLSTAVAFHGTYGTGDIKLRSSNPMDPPIIDPKFLSNPFDKRTAIESVRETLGFLNKPLMAKGLKRFAAAPTGDTDEEILAYVRRTVRGMWHACGTVKMGKLGEEGTCVDKDLKVVGIDSLRVADMSVVPFLPSAHTQAVAYVVGETAAEKIIAEYIDSSNSS